MVATTRNGGRSRDGRGERSKTPTRSRSRQVSRSRSPIISDEARRLAAERRARQAASSQGATFRTPSPPVISDPRDRQGSQRAQSRRPSQSRHQSQARRSPSRRSSQRRRSPTSNRTSQPRQNSQRRRSPTTGRNRTPSRRDRDRDQSRHRNSHSRRRSPHGASSRRRSRTSTPSRGQGDSDRRRRGQQPYDPASPTGHISQNAFADQLARFRDEIVNQFKSTKDEQANKIAQIQRRVELSADRPFRHEYNQDNDDKARSFLVFLEQIEQDFKLNRDDDAFNTIEVFRAAISEYL